MRFWLVRYALVLAIGWLAVPVAAAQDLAGAPGTVIDVVGPGDTLSVTVYGQPDASAQATVGEDGAVVLPLLGTLSVAGLSPADIGRRVAAGLRAQGYLLDPQVGVEIVRVRSRMVSVLGEIGRPGRYVLERDLTVLGLLAQAGGLRDTAGDVAMLMRGGDSATPLSLFVGNRLAPSQSLQDAELAPGDVVYVAPAARFYVSGEVGRPGGYPIEHDLNVVRALALAGGINPRGSERRMVIQRTDPVTGEVARLRAVLADRILPGDVLYVDERIF